MRRLAGVSWVRWAWAAWVAALMWAATGSAWALTVTAVRRINPPATGLDQIRGKPGDQVEIRGTGLATVKSVRFGLGTATFSGTDQRLVAIIPPSATIGSLSLYDGFGLAWASDFNFQVAPRVARRCRSRKPRRMRSGWLRATPCGSRATILRIPGMRTSRRGRGFRRQRGRGWRR